MACDGSVKSEIGLLGESYGVLGRGSFCELRALLLEMVETKHPDQGFYHGILGDKEAGWESSHNSQAATKGTRSHRESDQEKIGFVLWDGHGK